MKRHIGIAALVLALVVLATTSPAAAMKKEFVLTPTSPSASEMAGIGQIAKGKGFEQFQVRVFADMKDGAGFLVLVKRRSPSIGDAKLIPVGKMELRLGSAILDLNTKQHVSKAFPVMGLDEVIVQFKGKTVLAGKVFTPAPSE